MKKRKKELILLPRESLVKTGTLDHGDWNYSSILGKIQRMRFKAVVSMLQECRFGKILEVGYGSGIFLPELARHCEDLYGIDTHSMNQKVEEILAKNNLEVSLKSRSVTKMPFENQFFDCVIAISTLEFVDDVDAACVEIARVLKPTGIFIVITPGFSRFVDIGLRVLTGKSANKDYANR